MKHYLLPILLLPFATACSGDKDALEGSWVEPIPGQTSQQGFTLKKDGTASSVNMATLLWKSWKRDGNNLIMTGESIGNGISFEFSDTLRIEKLTADSLLLKRGDNIMGFARM